MLRATANSPSFPSVIPMKIENTSSISNLSGQVVLFIQRRRWFCFAIVILLLNFIFLCSSTYCFKSKESTDSSFSSSPSRSRRSSSLTPTYNMKPWVKKWVGPADDYRPNFTLTSAIRFPRPNSQDIIDFEGMCTKEIIVPKVDRTKRRIFVMSMFQSSPEARAIIPYFFDHYTSLGVPPENFLITIQTPNFTQTEYLKTKEVVEALGGTVGIVDGEYTTFQNSLAVESWWRIVPFTYHDWVIPADMDELHWYPEKLSQMLSTAEDNNWSYIKGGFIDRVRSDGDMVALAPFSKEKGPTIWDQYSMDCNLNPLTHSGRENDKGGGLNYRKVVLHRAIIVPTRGHHNVNTTIPHTVSGVNKLLVVPTELLNTSPDIFVPTYHFKWTDNAKKSLKERIETYSRLKIPWFVASARWLKHFQEHDGKICTQCEETGCKPGFNPNHPR